MIVKTTNRDSSLTKKEHHVHSVHMVTTTVKLQKGPKLS